LIEQKVVFIDFTVERLSNYLFLFIFGQFFFVNLNQTKHLIMRIFFLVTLMFFGCNTNELEEQSDQAIEKGAPERSE